MRGDPNDTLIPQSRDGFEGMTYREAAYRFWDKCRRVRDAANVDIAYSTTSVLADLIDPTCEMDDAGDVPASVKDNLNTFFCSECGSPNYNDMSPSYSPYCGRRCVG